MYSPDNGPIVLDRNGMRCRPGKNRNRATAIPWLLATFSGLAYLALLALALPARADVEHPKRASFHHGEGAHPHFQDPELAALRDYAQQIGIYDPRSTSAPQLRVAEADSAFE